MYRSNYRVPKPCPELIGQLLKKTIYVLPDSSLELDKNNRLRSTLPSGQINRYNLSEIETILAFGNVNLDSYLIPQVLAAGVPIAFFDRGKFLGRLEPSTSDRADMLQAQVEIELERKLNLASQMVWGIARRNRVFIARIQKDKQNPDLNCAMKELKDVADSVFRYQDLAQVVGSIGKIFEIYYRCFPLLLNSDWEFSRSEETPLNRMLEFVYALLEESVKSAIIGAGLNPSVGIWHSDRAKQPLVRDLVAEFKSFADAVVVRAINRNQIVLKDFDIDGDKLSRQVTAILVREYEKKMTEEFAYPHLGFRCTYQEAISLQAKQIAWYVSGKINDYFSLVLR